MRIDELEQEESDIDWFAVDAAGCVLHFASGGGRLPASVAASQEVLLQLHQYFLGLPDTPGAALVLPEPNAVRSGRSAQGFVRYARRGLFSFDKTALPDPADARYHLVARPARALQLAELPAPLATLLGRTRLPGAVADVAEVDISTID
jgi:hypothetical protein